MENPNFTHKKWDGLFLIFVAKSHTNDPGMVNIGRAGPR